jgi:RNA-directed DNA polymerase
MPLFVENEERKSPLAMYNGFGPQWNSGASHMNDAFRKNYFDGLGLVNLLETLLRNRTV